MFQLISHDCNRPLYQSVFDHQEGNWHHFSYGTSPFCRLRIIVYHIPKLFLSHFGKTFLHILSPSPCALRSTAMLDFLVAEQPHGVAEARLLLHVSKPDIFSSVDLLVLRSSSAIT